MWISTTKSQSAFALDCANELLEILADCAEASVVWVKLTAETSSNP
jgi:hypothetical protein